MRPWRRRFWLQRAVRWTLLGLAASLGATAAVLLAARIVPWADARWWALGVALFGPLAGLAYALATPPSLARTARQVDRRLGLADRLGTAWELRHGEDPLASLQRRDALTALRGHTTSAISLRPGRRPVGATLAALAVVVLLVLLPNPMDDVLAERQELQEQVAEASEELRKAQEELAQPDSPLSAEEREALEEALKALEERLAQAQDKPEALAALSEAERAVAELRESPLQQSGQSQALQDVAAALDNVPAGSQVAETLQSGDSEALGQALEALAEQLESLSPEERNALMAALQQAANATAGTGEMSAALREAARALGSADLSTGSGQAAVEAALGDLATLLADLQDGAAAEQAIADILAAINASRASISGASLASAGGPSQGSGPAAGADSGDGGEGEGSGAGDGSGNGNGDGSGSGSPGVGSGAGQGGSSAGNAPGAQQGESTDRVGAGGETIFVPSQGQGGLPGISVGAGPGTVPGELRPYDEVVGQYAAQARDHMERSPVPEGYKDLVRRYFAELE